MIKDTPYELKIRKKNKILYGAVIILFITNLVTYFYHSEIVVKVNKIIGVLKNLGQWLKEEGESNYKVIIYINAQISEVFNNRELAIIIWSLIGVIFVWVASKNMRELLIKVVKCLFCKQFIKLYIAMGIYIAFVIYFLWKIGYWQIELLKDTIIWFCFTGIILAFKTIHQGKNLSYFKQILVDSFKISIVVQYIIGAYNCSLWEELILIPLMLFMILLDYVLESQEQFNNEDYKLLKKIVKVSNIIMGGYIIGVAVISAITDFKNLLKIDVVKAIAFPSIMTASFLLFLYFFVIILGYEQIFSGLKTIGSQEKKLKTYIKVKVIIVCKGSLSKIYKIWKSIGLGLLRSNTKQEVNKCINRFKEELRA